MARPRQELDKRLVDILREFHIPDDHLYFQEPSNKNMKYPCIVYRYGRPATEFANNKFYRDFVQYDVTVITKNPDSALPDALRGSFPYCSIDRTYAADNLNHTALTLYF